MSEHVCKCEEEEVITEEKINKFKEIMKNRSGSSELISVLHEAQQIFGFLPKEVQELVAEGLCVPLSEVFGVVTFYSLFSMKPQGKHKVCVCKGTACYVRGADKVLERLEKELGVGPGDTTKDGEFSIEITRCIGACGLGPVATIDDQTYARIKPDKIPSILDKYRKA